MSEPTPELEPWPLPVVDDVAALLRARTKDADGAELGTFTDATRPTADEVERLIARAYGDVSTQTGAVLGERLALEAAAMVALRAAMFVELSYFPEQVRTDRSAYQEYERIYDAGMTALRLAIEGESGEFGSRFGTLRLETPNRRGGSVWPEPENPANWPDPFNPPRSPVGDEPASELQPVELRIGHRWPST